MRPGLLLYLMLSIAFSGATFSAQALSGNTSTVHVRLLALNDFHGRLLPSGDMLNPLYVGDLRHDHIPVGGISRMSSLVQQLRAASTHSVVVAAGDLIGASAPESGLFHDEPTIEALTALGLEYSAVGNHEFDEGWSELQRMQIGGCHPLEQRNVGSCIQDEFRGAGFRYLAANVIEKTNHAPAFPGSVIHTITHTNGKSHIGIIGAVLKNTKRLVVADGIAGLIFKDEARSINAHVATLQAAGVESIVLLIHEGAESDKNYNHNGCPGLSGAILPIVDRLDPAVDVIVSGHTHRAYTCKVGKRLLTSAGSNGRMLTQIDLQIALNDGDVVAASAKNLPVVADHAPVPSGYQTLHTDPAIDELLQPYLNQANERMNAPVGRIRGDFIRKPQRNGQSTLGLLIANAQLAATQALGADIALTNPGGIRANLLQPPADAALRFGQLYSVQPFSNTLVLVTMTGAQLKSILETPLGSAHPRLLQTSRGLGYHWNPAKPHGQRISNLRLHGQPVKTEQTYKVTVNSYLAAGSGGYAAFKQYPQSESGITDIDAFARYLQRTARTPQINTEIHRAPADPAHLPRNE